MGNRHYSTGTIEGPLLVYRAAGTTPTALLRGHYSIAIVFRQCTGARCIMSIDPKFVELTADVPKIVL